MPSADYWINKLNLVPHPRGGYWAEQYRSKEQYPTGFLAQYAGPRTLSTAIYFLLPSQQVATLLRIASDEIWHFYHGSPITLHQFDVAAGTYHATVLGPNLEGGQTFIALKPANVFFGATVNDPDRFSLVGRVLAPGFASPDWADAAIPALMQQFPQQQALITRLSWV
jgi:predicted cupin superfamily sugar epimerase